MTQKKWMDTATTPAKIFSLSRSSVLSALLLFALSACTFANSDFNAAQDASLNIPQETAPALLSPFEEKRNTFITRMVSTHQFDEQELTQLFQTLKPNESVLQKISSPKESLPWYKYRKIFLDNARIKEGAQFWRENAKLLRRVEKQYGVPAQIIVAIIGVETLYGKRPGNTRVLDALATLAFTYPPRSEFFLGELEKFLLLCREEHLNPLEPKGSYAGAMGIPQFMPSSFLNFSADFDKDGRRDIWHNNGDVFASIANYFKEHQWLTNHMVAAKLPKNHKKQKKAPPSKLKTHLRKAKIESPRVEILGSQPVTAEVKILALEQQQGEELWEVYHNFNVITEYNRSPLYAMAVYQLSQAILDRKGAYP